MEDREFPCSVHVNESAGRLEVRTDTKVHVYSESENQMILDTVVRLRAENAKLRDAMYTNAGKNALQHMDEDELRIWATQQSEYIDQLEELVRDMWRFTGAACKKYPRLFDPAAAGGQMVQLNALDAIEQRMRDLGIEVSDV